ncbi:hypothetical protein GALMADRAFT_259368 [Galerina marginata CBS 339.88]|uniref:Uncharacterized protein n=1 Tax=Galerina marginata (strain CBS 339.88) TaxID=685588 RepID=A0A067S682_GALM3|nr:hypothetical protein GALMADRAFT_259368 [Galerina marginata CBS 339.88]
MDRFVESLHPADSDFDFKAQVFKGIHLGARACDGSDYEEVDSPLTPLTDASRSTSPEPRPRTPTTTPGPALPSSLSPEALTSTPSAPPTRGEKRKAKKKQQGRRNAKEKKAKIRESGPKPALALKQIQTAVGVSSTYSAQDFDIASTGYISQRERGHSATFSLDQVVGPNSRYKFELKEWDGRNPMPIVDREDLVIGVCAGLPRGDETWDSLQLRASDLLEEARPRLCFNKKDLKHRRGSFPALAVGISHGGGQSYPKTLVHEPQNDSVLDALLQEDVFHRISGFSTGAFTTWAPRLCRYQTDNLSKVIAHDYELRAKNEHPKPEDKELRRNFPQTPWAATTLNFGPRTVCYKHADFGNLAFGWCAITALGEFDYKKGGHLILWDLGLVIEFPPGSTILIPSSAIRHSNTRIQIGERRYSFTQYSAGGIFRWVDNGFKTVVDRVCSMNPAEHVALLDDLSNQLEYGLSLYSTLKELETLANQSIRKPAVV